MKYREAWEMYSSIIPTMFKLGLEYNDAIARWRHTWKLKAREIYREEERTKDPYRVYVIDRGDDYIEKLVGDYDGETREEVEEWFRDNYYRTYCDRGYDCTGQLFTSWYKIFLVDGKWIIYHCIAIDC